MRRTPEFLFEPDWSLEDMDPPPPQPAGGRPSCERRARSACASSRRCRSSTSAPRCTGSRCWRGTSPRGAARRWLCFAPRRSSGAWWRARPTRSWALRQRGDRAGEPAGRAHAGLPPRGAARQGRRPALAGSHAPGLRGPARHADCPTQAEPIGEVFARRRDGTGFPAELWVNTVHTDEGPLTLCSARDVSERARLERRLEYLAEHDELTGLLNRRGFNRELGRWLAYASRYGGGGAALMVDLDGFKHVNDNVRSPHRRPLPGDGGELACADGCAPRTSSRGSEATSSPCCSPRWMRSQAERVAVELKEAIDETAAGDQAVDVTASIGIAAFLGGNVPPSPADRDGGQRALSREGRRSRLRGRDGLRRWAGPIGSVLHDVLDRRSRSSQRGDGCGGAVALVLRRLGGAVGRAGRGGRRHAGVRRSGLRTARPRAHAQGQERTGRACRAGGRRPRVGQPPGRHARRIRPRCGAHGAQVHPRGRPPARARRSRRRPT